MKLKIIIVLSLITIISSCTRVAFNCPRQYVAYGKNVLLDSVNKTRAEIVEFSGKCQLKEQQIFHLINLKLETDSQGINLERGSTSKKGLQPIKDLSIVVINSSGEIVSKKNYDFTIKVGDLNTFVIEDELSFDLSDIEASVTSYSIVAGFF